MAPADRDRRDLPRLRDPQEVPPGSRLGARHRRQRPAALAEVGGQPHLSSAGGNRVCVAAWRAVRQVPNDPTILVPL